MLKFKVLEIEMFNKGMVYCLLWIKKMQVFFDNKLILEMDQVKDLEFENILVGVICKFIINVFKDIFVKDIKVKIFFEDIVD